MNFTACKLRNSSSRMSVWNPGWKINSIILQMHNFTEGVGKKGTYLTLDNTALTRHCKCKELYKTTLYYGS